MLKQLATSAGKLFSLVAHRFSLLLGDIAGFLLLYLALAITADAILRYVFNSPTIWVMETSTYLLVVIISLGLAYTQMEKGHVRVDVVINRLPRQAQNWVRVINSIFFFIMVAFLFHLTWDAFMVTVHFGTTSRTALDIVLAPFQAAIPIGLLVMILLLICNIYSETKIALGKSEELKLKESK